MALTANHLHSQMFSYIILKRILPISPKSASSSVLWGKSQGCDLRFLLNVQEMETVSVICVCVCMCMNVCNGVCVCVCVHASIYMFSAVHLKPFSWLFHNCLDTNLFTFDPITFTDHLTHLSYQWVVSHLGMGYLKYELSRILLNRWIISRQEWLFRGIILYCKHLPKCFWQLIWHIIPNHKVVIDAVRWLHNPPPHTRNISLTVII